MTNVEPISDDEIVSLFAGLESTPLALAVSGGADSMALMHMAARWAKREEVRAAYQDCWTRRVDSRPLSSVWATAIDGTGLSPPSWLDEHVTLADFKNGASPHIVVLTVDHGLRDASASDAAFVSEEATKLGLACLVLRWEGTKPATGTQEAARAARRDLMLDVLRAEEAHVSPIFRKARLGDYLKRVLVMAHHLEDQAETVLMRLARGSGLEGLGGMRPRDIATRAATAERPEHFSAEVHRPLLDVPKARLVATLEAYGVRWVEDPSNEDERFERVRVRKALAQLSEVGLSAEKIALSARRLRDADEAIEQSQILAIDPERNSWATGKVLPDVWTPLYAGLDIFGPRFASDYLRVRTLRWVMRTYGGGARPAELAQLEDLVARLGVQRHSMSGGVTLGGCKIEFHGEHGRQIRIFREGSGEGLPVLPIAPGQSVDWDGRRFTVHAQALAKPRAVIRALGLQGWVEVKRLVPGLAKLGLPAAAAATLPVVADAETGQVVSYNALDGVLRHMRGPQGDNLGEAVPTPVWEEWQASGLTGGEYHIIFKGLAGTW